MNCKYLIKIETPEGFAVISANSQEQIKKIVEQGPVTQIIAILSNKDLNSQYAKFHSKYSADKKTNQQSRIWKAGLEKVVLGCYLKGMQLLETKDFLEKNRNFIASRSAIHRYWVKFGKCGIIPLALKRGS